MTPTAEDRVEAVRRFGPCPAADVCREYPRTKVARLTGLVAAAAAVLIDLAIIRCAGRPSTALDCSSQNQPFVDSSGAQSRWPVEAIR